MSGLQCWTSGVNTFDKCELLAEALLRPRSVIYRAITAMLASSRNSRAQRLRVGWLTGRWRALATGRRCVMSPPGDTTFPIERVFYYDFSLTFFTDQLHRLLHSPLP